MQLDTQQHVLAVGGHTVRYLLIGNDQNIWFQGKPLAEILEYVNTRQAVIDHVPEIHRMRLQGLVVAYGTTKVICQQRSHQQTVIPWVLDITRGMIEK